MAEDLLARFPGMDRAELLKKMVAGCFFDMRFGNKREERAACDFLNEVQVNAHKLQHAPAEPSNEKLRHPAGKTEGARKEKYQ